MSEEKIPLKVAEEAVINVRYRCVVDEHVKKKLDMLNQHMEKIRGYRRILKSLEKRKIPIECKNAIKTLLTDTEYSYDQTLMEILKTCKIEKFNIKMVKKEEAK